MGITDNTDKYLADFTSFKKYIIDSTIKAKAKEGYETLIVLFFSIDLVNSTQFKNRYPSKWGIVFSDFYTCASRAAKNGWIVWKYLGDEVLFYREAKSIEKVIRAPSETHKIMTTVFKELSAEYAYINGNIYPKGTLWMGKVTQPGKEKNDDDYPFSYIIGSDDQPQDFVGPDIDEGFRLGKFSAPNKIAIDPKIACLLLENTDLLIEECDYAIEQRLKICAYRELKGVNANRPYPIIWYHNNWDGEDAFLYDEDRISDVSKELINKTRAFEDIKLVRKIILESGQHLKVEQIKKFLNRNSNQPIFQKTKNVELHVAAVCIEKNQRKALIIKRASEKHNGGKWEFGCAKASNFSKLSDTIKQEYKEDFGIAIDLITDKNRDDDVPIPIALYELKGARPLQDAMPKGIIAVATFDESNGIDLNESKHSSFRLIAETEIDDFSEPAVDDFKASLKAAFELFKKETANAN